MKIKAIEPGSLVKLKTREEELQAIVLESHDPEIILLKLNSGYNIGIKEEEILDIKVLKKPAKLKEKHEREAEEKLKRDKTKPNIALIITGGTISSQLDPTTGAVKWLTRPDELLKFYPEISNIANISKIEIPFMKASENMDSEDWKKIAKTAQKLLNNSNISGIIITHGTDFLHYTSAALSFFLSNLNKPVVLTYSQRSSDRASSDTRLNLLCAARAAISEIAEVMLVGHASINDDFCYAIPGTKVRKMHTSRRDTFKPINTKPIAKIWPDKIERISNYNLRDERKKVELNAHFNKKVALLKFYPGMKPNLIEHLAKNNKGIVIEASGLGHLAITKEARNNLLPKLKKAIKKGTVICAAPQTIFGRLDPYVYSPGRQLVEAGIIFLEDMLSETALVKLGWVLGNKKWARSKEKIKEIMLQNIAGEFNPRIEQSEFI